MANNVRRYEIMSHFIPASLFSHPIGAAGFTGCVLRAPSGAVRHIVSSRMEAERVIFKFVSKMLIKSGIVAMSGFSGGKCNM